MATIKKPNTICRNPNCTHGEDGGRKHFYACMTCMRKESWRAYCCSVGCYEEYTRIILDSRAKANKLPERTDMTVQEIKEVMEKPMAEVEEFTKTVELKEYFDENPGASLAEVIEQVNEDIDTDRKSRKRKR